MNKRIGKINSFSKESKPHLDSKLLKDVVIVTDVSDGARTKYWVCDNPGNIYLYKQSKINSFGEYTFEHVSEYLAFLIGDALGISCCDVVLGDYDVLSKVMWKEELKSFVELSDEMSHSFYLSNLQTYNISTLLCEKTNPYYVDVIRMLLFDAFIGNSDRHPGNYMYNDKLGFYPLFDNGSSLCSYVRDADVDQVLHDSMRFIAMNTTKSKPVLRDVQKITHEQLVNILTTQYPQIVKDFSLAVDSLNISTILDQVEMTEKHAELIKSFLEYRKRWFVE